MRPEAASARAGALWQALGAAYEEIARRLESREWSGIEALGHRITEIQTELEALLAAGATIGGGARELQALSARRADLERLAVSARAATAAALAKARRDRTDSQRYRVSPPTPPRFTSHRI